MRYSLNHRALQQFKQLRKLLRKLLLDQLDQPPWTLAQFFAFWVSNAPRICRRSAGYPPAPPLRVKPPPRNQSRPSIKSVAIAPPPH